MGSQLTPIIYGDKSSDDPALGLELNDVITHGDSSKLLDGVGQVFGLGGILVLESLDGFNSVFQSSNSLD